MDIIYQVQVFGSYVNDNTNHKSLVGAEEQLQEVKKEYFGSHLKVVTDEDHLIEFTSLDSDKIILTIKLKEKMLFD